MRSGPPNGFFAGGLLLYGPLGKGGVAAKGYLLQTPDLRGASVAQLNAYQDKIRLLLATIGEGTRAQFQWVGNGDYVPELTRFYRETEQITHPQIKQRAMAQWRRLWRKMQRRELRREQLVLFLSTEITAHAGSRLTAAALESYYEKLLAQLRAQFEEMTGTLRTIFGTDTTVAPMDDLGHFSYYDKFLNPSLAERFDVDFAAQLNPALSIQENCWNGDGVGLQKIGFYLDGRYHAVFALKRWPSRTSPGIIWRLTGLEFLDYQITVNIEPLPAKREVDKEEKAIERLRGEYQDTERHSLLVAIGKKERKIESLSTGFIHPFVVTYIVRVWDESEQGLAAKCAAIKNAINGMAGAQYYECSRPSTAKKLFFASWPGWTHSAYRHRSLYAEDAYLADMLPFSATFTGHLGEAEAIFEGSQKNLVGLRTFLGIPPSPQHMLLCGATGAGKSRLMLDLLWQTAGRFAYTMLIEEGLSYESFTKAMGERPIVLHPDGDLTINYFDTGGMPLGQLQLATGVALAARMIGDPPDAETQQIRQALLGQYIQQLYQDAFEEWSKRNQQALPDLQRHACAVHRWKERMGAGTTEIEAYADLRDRLASGEDEAQQFTADISESDITGFLKHPRTERAVMALAHARYTKEDFPTHASLVELMRFARLPEHKKEQVDHLATLLAAWCAHGQYATFLAQLAHRLLRFQQLKQEFFSCGLRVRAMDRAAVVDRDAAVHPAEVSPLAIRLFVAPPVGGPEVQILVPKHEQRIHPLLFFVVLHHRRHGLVLVDQRAHPAAEAAVSATGCRRIDHQRALAVRRGPLVHRQQVLVVVSPWIRELHQEHPHVVIRPVLDDGIDERPRQGGVGT